MVVSIELLLLLFVIAMIAGWVDTLAGGGGLIILPVLLLAGLAPASALATNKLQGSVGTLTASMYFIRKKSVNLNQLKWAIVLTFVGSVVGSWLVLRTDPDHLNLVLAILLMGIGLYYLFSSSISHKARSGRVSLGVFALLAASVLGFYDGFFGPGTGALMALAFIVLLGYSLPQATAHAKVLNFVSNISALGYFIIYTEINWTVGVVMMLGQLIGAIVGAKMVMDKGTAIIRPVVVIVCFLMTLNMLFKEFW